MHAVGGGHNDAVMVALIVAGLVVVTAAGADWRHLVGGAGADHAGRGGEVARAWSRWRSRCRSIWPAGRTCGAGIWVRYCAIAAAVAVPVFAIVSVIAGVGLGWTKQVSSGVPVINFMSLPTLLAVLLPGRDRRRARRHPGRRHGPRLPDRRHRWSARLLLVWLWLPGGARHGDRKAAMKLLTVGLFTVVVLGPAVQPWYFSWALTIGAV